MALTSEPGESAGSLPQAVQAPIGAIESHLEQAIEQTSAPRSLRDAMRYATLEGGKRLRPLLAWHACVAAGGEGPEALAACSAVELIHCFSLVHDDLPALDDDDVRRGRPTLHKHAGEAMAILAGDALLTHAFGVLATGDAARFSALAGELAQACEAMIAGQVLDTLGFEGEPDAESMSDQARLETIHRGKTGAMLVASVRMGALSAPSVTPATLASLTSFAHAAGLMFQIVDDLLDVTQTSEHLGKRAGKDQAAGKTTYPGVLGVERSRVMVRELEDQALNALAGCGDQAEPLRRLARYLAVRTK